MVFIGPTYGFDRSIVPGLLNDPALAELWPLLSRQRQPVLLARPFRLAISELLTTSTLVELARQRHPEISLTHLGRVADEWYRRRLLCIRPDIPLWFDDWPPGEHTPITRLTRRYRILIAEGALVATQLSFPYKRGATRSHPDLPRQLSAMLADIAQMLAERYPVSVPPVTENYLSGANLSSCRAIWADYLALVATDSLDELFAALVDPW